MNDRIKQTKSRQRLADSDCETLKAFREEWFTTRW